MTTALFAIVLAASGFVCHSDLLDDEGKRLIEAGRHGDDQARRRIQEFLLRETADLEGQMLGVIDSLCTPDDIWASETLKQVALHDTGREVQALVSWWKLHQGKDASLAREVLSKRGKDTALRWAAIELLVSIGDDSAAKALESARLEACAETRRDGHLGILFGKPSVLSPEEGQKTYRELVVVYLCTRSRAAAAGFHIGDTVVAVDGKKCEQRVQCLDLIATTWDTAKLVEVTVQTKEGEVAIRKVPPATTIP